MSAYLMTSTQKWEENQKKFSELSSLAKGWDSYKALPVTRRALNEAKGFLSSFNLPYVPLGFACPLSDGGMQVEWHCGGWDIEIEISADAREVNVGFAPSNPVFNSEEWVDGDYLDHAERLREIFKEINSYYEKEFLALASKRAEEDRDAELLRLRKALLDISTVDNSPIICGLHSGQRSDGECGCGISLDADEKARQLAISALRIGKEHSNDA
jgi:hypothetical protein